jgi:ectoine hydroxylase-related dioxygenase (phytanoyl-CoA dioxygenase family)
VPLDHASIPETLVTEYERDGAVILRGVVPMHWIERLRAGVDENMRAPGPYGKRYTPDGKPGMFFGDYCNWRRIDAYRDFLKDGPIGALAAQMMRSRRVNLFHEHVLVKEPGTAEPTPWHHDQPYWSVDGRQVMSFWIPLDPVARETCVEYVAGSHLSGIWYSPTRFADAKTHPSRDPNFRPVPDIDANRDAYRLLGWDLEPGDCIAFHALTLHGAPGNRGGRRRRAFAARVTGDDAQFVLRDGFMSPPPPADAPPSGTPMSGPAFPEIWPRPAGTVSA